MRLLATVGAASVALFARPALSDDIRLTCVSTAVSGTRHASYPSEFIKELVINPQARRVNGQVWDDSVMHATPTSLDFPLCANGICGQMNIDRDTGRFVFSRADEISYTGHCRRVPRPHF